MECKCKAATMDFKEEKLQESITMLHNIVCDFRVDTQYDEGFFVGYKKIDSIPLAFKALTEQLKIKFSIKGKKNDQMATSRK